MLIAWDDNYSASETPGLLPEHLDPQILHVSVEMQLQNERPNLSHMQDCQCVHVSTDAGVYLCRVGLHATRV